MDFEIMNEIVFITCAEGYGQVMIGRIRQVKQWALCKPVEFPLVLGRDFVGEIVVKGKNVPSEDLNVGDVIMGVLAPYERGCHAEYVIVPKTQVGINIK